MLTMSTRIKNIVFVVITILVVAYIGTRYIGVGRFVGLGGYYTVKADLPTTGGLYPNANVTYRGVSVGRVGALRLTGSGVQADLHIHDGTRVPAHLTAVVANLSAAGEEYVDLRPDTSTGPYLADGAEIPQSDTSVPLPVTSVLTDLNTFASSIPLDSLRTTVVELGDAFAGQGGNLQTLLDSSQSFIQQADDASTTTTKLTNDARVVLHTQNDEAGALRSFANSATLLSQQLDASDSDLRRLIVSAPGAAVQLNGLFRDLDPQFSVLLANLLTTSEVATTRVDGLRELLVQAPKVLAAGSTTVTPTKASFGLGLTFFAPLPCTSGYGGTTYRNGLTTSAGPALNTAASCKSPSSSGIDVRGSAHSPDAGDGVPAAAKPGSAATTAAPGALGLQPLPAGPTGLPGLLGLGE